MKKEKHTQLLLNCILAAMMVFCGVVVICDLSQPLLHIPRKAFSILTFFGVIPLCVGLSGIARRAHPEFFEDGDERE